MNIYSFRANYPIILGIPIMHLLILSLSFFFTKRFIVESYDPVAIILLIILLGPLVYVDLGLYRLKIYHRCFMKCKVNEAGIFCYGFGIKAWHIAWEDIHTYGITGYDTPNQPYALVFFSKIIQEKNDLKQKIQINNQRIVIQMREEAWAALRPHMPTDMEKRISNAMAKKSDFLCRR